MTTQNTKWPSVFYTVWDEAWAALSQPRQYIKWAYQPFGRSVAYLSILLGIMSVVATIFYFINIRPQIQVGQDWLSENVPLVTFTDGRMTIEGDQTYLLSDSQEFFFKVDPVDTLDDAAVDPFYQVGILLLGDGIYTRKGFQEKNVTYDEIGLTNTSFTGQDLAIGLGKITNALQYIAPFLIFAYLLVSNLIFTMIAAVFFYFIGGMRVRFLGIWSMALYALTPSLLASYVAFLFLPVDWLSKIVFIAYMTMAAINLQKFLDFQDQYRAQGK